MDGMLPKSKKISSVREIYVTPSFIRKKYTGKLHHFI